jgi:hypothetical protein
MRTIIAAMADAVRDLPNIGEAARSLPGILATAKCPGLLKAVAGMLGEIPDE